MSWSPRQKTTWDDTPRPYSSGACRVPTSGAPPTGPQLTFLMCEDREALYGGAAGGGKTELCVSTF
jgi:hypothetical protein